MSNLLDSKTLLANIAVRADVTQTMAARLLSALAIVAGEALAADQTVRLPGIGDLKPKRVAARAGVCAFGEYSKPAHRRVTLRLAKAMADRTRAIL